MHTLVHYALILFPEVDMFLLSNVLLLIYKYFNLQKKKKLDVEVFHAKQIFIKATDLKESSELTVLQFLHISSDYQMKNVSSKN